MTGQEYADNARPDRKNIPEMCFLLRRFCGVRYPSIAELASLELNPLIP